MSAEDFIPEARHGGISANNRHNDFNQNMDQTLDKYLTSIFIHFEKEMV